MAREQWIHNHSGESGQAGAMIEGDTDRATGLGKRVADVARRSGGGIQNDMVRASTGCD